MTVPFYHFMLKETQIKASMSYDDGDFKATVDAFVAGKPSLTVFIFVC